MAFSLALCVLCGCVAFNLVLPLLPAWGRPSQENAFVALALVDAASVTAASCAALANVVATHAPAVGAYGACATFFATANVAILTRWYVLAVPVRLMVLPEAARNAVVALAACAHVRAAGGLTLGAGLRLGARAVASTLLAPLLCGAFQRGSDMAFKQAHLPRALCGCPRPLRRWVAACERASLACSCLAAPEVAMSYMTLLTPALAALALCLADRRALDTVSVARTYIAFSLSACLAGAVSRALFTREPLVVLERRLGGGGEGGRAARRAALAEQLRASVSEHDVLCAAAEQLRSLLPGARCCALATLVDAELCHLEVSGGGRCSRVVRQLGS